MYILTLFFKSVDSCITPLFTKFWFIIIKIRSRSLKRLESELLNRMSDYSTLIGMSLFGIDSAKMIS